MRACGSRVIFTVLYCGTELNKNLSEKKIQLAENKQPPKMSGFKTSVRSLYAESYESDYKKKESPAFSLLLATAGSLADLEIVADDIKAKAKKLKTWKTKEQAATVPDSEVNKYHAAVAEYKVHMEKVKLKKEEITERARDVLSEDGGDTYGKTLTEVIKSARIRLDRAIEYRVGTIPKQAESVDVCFVIDATSSKAMEKIIHELRVCIKETVVWVRQTCKHGDFRIALVIYRDFENVSLKAKGEKAIAKPTKDQVVVHPFEIFDLETPKMSKFEVALKDTIVGGGGDECEDVIGGLEAAAALDWRAGSKILFFACDAPCHGDRFHVNECGDDFGEGIEGQVHIGNVLDILKNGVGRGKHSGVDFTFLKVNETTNVMIEEFNKILRNGEKEGVKISGEGITKKSDGASGTENNDGDKDDEDDKDDKDVKDDEDDKVDKDDKDDEDDRNEDDKNEDDKDEDDKDDNGDTDGKGEDEIVTADFIKTIPLDMYYLHDTLNHVLKDVLERVITKTIVKGEALTEAQLRRKKTFKAGGIMDDLAREMEDLKPY